MLYSSLWTSFRNPMISRLLLNISLLKISIPQRPVIRIIWISIRMVTVIYPPGNLKDFTGIYVDGYCGALVGVFIMFAGIGAAKDTLNPLLGQPPEEEFVQKIDQIVMAHEEICGIHDLIVHDYGPGRQMVSLHAEVPAEGNILEIHDIIDNVENELKEKLGCDATIHMDPIVTSDEHVSEMKAAVISIIKGIDERINMHDFRVVTGPTHTNIIFDVLIPYKFQIQDDELAARITSQVRERLGNNYYVVIKVDHSYV